MRFYTTNNRMILGKIVLTRFEEESYSIISFLGGREEKDECLGSFFLPYFFFTLFGWSFSFTKILECFEKNYIEWVVGESCPNF